MPGTRKESLETMESISSLISAASSYIPRIRPMDIFEMLIMCIVMHKILLLAKETRAWVFAKGLLVLLIAYVAADAVGFNVIRIIFQSLFSVLAILMVVLFQQEIKKMVSEIGKTGKLLKIRKRKGRTEKRISDEGIKAIEEAVEDMSSAMTGALILIEKEIPLKEWSATGIPVNADITRQMLVQIFEKNTPLHDGAVIIRGGRIESATCYLPLTKSPEIDKALGTRHRAGIGISEATDALVIIVSEETGQVSIAMNGRIQHGIPAGKLDEALKGIQDASPAPKKRKPLTHDMRTKLISLLSTVMLWMVVTNVADPTVTDTIEGVEVVIKNDSAITDSGLSYHVDDATVDVLVTGKRSTVDSLTSSDVHAYADLSKLSLSNAAEITAWTSKPGVTATPAEGMLSITVDSTKEAEYDITVATKGTLSEGMYVNSIDLDEPSVKVSGAVAKVDTIGSVEAEFSLTGAKDGSELTAQLKVYDRNGEDITDSLTLSAEEAIATISMYSTKTVPLTISARYDGDSGEITSYTYDKDEITVAGSDTTLETLSNVFMEVPITISDDVETTEFVRVINMSDFLPKDTYLAESDSKLSISISYEQYAEAEQTIKGSSISIVNADKSLSYEVEPLTVRLKGLTKDIEGAEVTAEIDVTGLKVGTYSVSATIDSKYVTGEYKTDVTVSEK